MFTEWLKWWDRHAWLAGLLTVVCWGYLSWCTLRRRR